MMIIQNIIPAYDWFAIYEEDDGSGYRIALTCFAQVSPRNELGDNEIVGFVPNEKGKIIPAFEYQPSEGCKFKQYELLKEEFDVEMMDFKDLN